MTSFVDQSARLTGRGRYVLVAVIVDLARTTAVRQALRDQLPPRQLRFHWRNERQLLRSAMVKAIAALDLTSIAVVVEPVAPKKSERARRLCTTRLLWELGERNERDVLFESG